EWHAWTNAEGAASGVKYWLGGVPHRAPPPTGVSRYIGPWRLYPHSGIAICDASPWWIRWDVSPLGYLSTAAHGHADALHLSLWLNGIAMIIDPGTGCYFVDPELRTWLASPSAHNGPNPVRSDWWPQRRGPFLWA